MNHKKESGCCLRGKGRLFNCSTVQLLYCYIIKELLLPRGLARGTQDSIAQLLQCYTAALL